GSWRHSSIRRTVAEGACAGRSALRCVRSRAGSEAEGAGEFGAGRRRTPSRSEYGLLDGSEELLLACVAGWSCGAELHLPLAPFPADAGAQVGRTHPVVDELGDHAVLAHQVVGGAGVLDAGDRA